MPLRFRSAALSDVDAVVRLVESAYRGPGSREGWTTEADLLDGQRTDAEQVSALIVDAGSRIVLALEGRELVGSMLLATASRSVYLGMLSVRPSHQAKGVGRALLAEAERIAQTERLGTRMKMTVIGQRTELIAWYERRGYVRTGAREPFPYGDPRFGLPRRPDLYFEVLEKQLASRKSG